MKTVLHIKTDKALKEKAQNLAESMGIPLSVLINATLHTFVRDKEVNFSYAPKMTPYLESIIREANKNEKDDSPYFRNVKDAKKWLLSK